MRDTPYDTWVFKTVQDPAWYQKVGQWLVRRVIWVLWMKHGFSERFLGINIVASSIGNDIRVMHKIHQACLEVDDHYAMREIVEAYSLGNEEKGDAIMAEGED